MPDIAEQNRFDVFLPKARAFVTSPSLMEGLELHDMIVRLRQFALTNLRDPELGRKLEAMLAAVHKQDTDSMRDLLDAVTLRLTNQGIINSRRG